MARIGFIGRHEISFHCLKKICELSLLYGDNVVVVFDLPTTEASKHSASISFTELQKEFKLALYHVSNVAEPANIEILKNANLDILFIIGWHRIVPQEVLDQAE